MYVFLQQCCISIILADLNPWHPAHIQHNEVFTFGLIKYLQYPSHNTEKVTATDLTSPCVAIHWQCSATSVGEFYKRIMKTTCQYRLGEGVSVVIHWQSSETSGGEFYKMRYKNNLSVWTGVRALVWLFIDRRGNSRRPTGHKARWNCIHVQLPYLST